MEVSDTWRYFSLLVLGHFLWIGTISACFQACGTEPVVNDALINLQSDGSISTAHSFKTRGGR